LAGSRRRESWPEVTGKALKDPVESKDVCVCYTTERITYVSED